jgi:hypothetical protein
MSETKTIVATSADGLSRREFTLEACLAILSGVAITISEGACGGSSYSSPTGPSSNPPTAGNGDKIGDISNNHGHTATITAAQLSAGNAITVQLTLGSGHTHSLAVSADQVIAIAANQRVSGVSSTTEDHNHTVTFN